MYSVTQFATFSSKAAPRRAAWPGCSRARKVSRAGAGLVMATILAGGPAAAGTPAPQSADGASAVALPADSCYDRVAVVLNNKPQRPPASASYIPETPSPDVHPIMVLSMDQSRPCTAYKPIGDMSPTTPAMWALGPEQDSSASLSAPHPAWLGVEAPRASSRSSALRLPPPDPLADAVPPDAPSINRFTADGGFQLSDGLLRRASGDESRGLAAASTSGAGGLPGGLGPTAGPLAASPLNAPDLTASAPPIGAPGIAGNPSGVPEPASWLMLVAGVFGLGAALRHRPHRLAA